jgi:hypothetical protein
VDHLNVRYSNLKGLEKNIYEIVGSMTVSFTLKMRGVPFEAGKKEIFDVRLFIIE